MTNEFQVFSYINQVLRNFNVAPNIIDENANLICDFNFTPQRVDALFSNVENHYALPYIMFNQDVATLGGLVRYILKHNGEVA